MPAPGLSLEEAAIASLVNVATVSMGHAQAALDSEKVQAQDFENATLRAVWAVVETMVREGRFPDLFAVQDRLPKAPRPLLAKLLVESDTTGSPAERLRLVREAGQRRRVGAALDSAKALLADSSQSLAHVASEARKALEALETQTATVGPLDSEVFALIDHLEAVLKGEREPVLPTGLEALDSAIGGLQPTLTILGALPGVGKSALLAAIVRNLANRGVPCGFFSLEDERRWLVDRMVSEASRVPLFVLRNRALHEYQQAAVYEKTPAVHAALKNVIVDDRPALTAPEVVASAREMLSRYRVKALFVDHLGEVRLQRSDRHDLDIADALQQLRALAKTYRVPVVVACHLRRREGLLQTDEPRLTDFAFSAAVERMARVALGLYRPKPVGENLEPPDALCIAVLKQTNGKAGVSLSLPIDGPSAIVRNESAPAVRRAVDALYNRGGSNAD